MQEDMSNGVAPSSATNENQHDRYLGFSEEWVPVGSCYTYVLRYGKLQPKQPLILIIPGNPGVADYYKEFMQVIHEKSHGHMALWSLSHAGHVTMPGNIPKTTSEEQDYRDLEGQIAHKLKFIKDYIPEDTPLVLIGHSIGCYMILKIMDVIDTSRIIQSVMLFPTIERMAEAPKGKMFTRMSPVLGAIGHYPVYPLYYLMPSVLRYYIAKFYFMGKVPEGALQATVKLVNPNCVANTIYLARTEMEQVKELDHDMIRRHLDKLMFYYGKTDHWCPLEYATEMKATHPNADVRICERGFEHAFCLTNSTGMAEVLWEWFIEKLPHIFIN